MGCAATTGTLPSRPGPYADGVKERVVKTALAVAIGALWPICMALGFGGPTALLLASSGGPSYAAVKADLPNAHLVPPPGHDGQQFYAIARNPFAMKANVAYLDGPSRRYRRILFPLLAGMISPANGVPLIVAMAVVSLIGVALGAWALDLMPGAPWWLAFAMPLNPAVVVALMTSLSDVLATGLILAMFAAAFYRKIALIVVLGVLACLTRETALLAVGTIALWPDIRLRERAAIALIPTGVLGAWSLYVSSAVGAASQGLWSGEFSWPFVGWADVPFFHHMLIPLALCVLIVAALCVRSTPRSIWLFLAANVVMATMLGPVINFNWTNSVRAIAPAIPLALWVLAHDKQSSAEFARRTISHQSVAATP